MVTLSPFRPCGDFLYRAELAKTLALWPALFFIAKQVVVVYHSLYKDRVVSVIECWCLNRNMTPINRPSTLDKTIPFFLKVID